jgi:hypothetical protein
MFALRKTSQISLINKLVKNKLKFASFSINLSRKQQSNSETVSDTIPSSTKVVICGGGLIGTSVAYHLGQLGYKDVVLVTRDK